MKLQEFFKNKEWKQWDKSQWIIVILTGVLLMIVAIPVDAPKDRKIETKDAKEEVLMNNDIKDDYVEQLEEKLERTLSKIEGAGLVEVMITLEDSGESIVEKDVTRENSDLDENDDVGGVRKEKIVHTGETTVYQEEDNAKVPFVGKEKSPKIAGILVVAQGGENTAVKQNISEGVMALFQIDVNRIKVVKMNIQEEGY